MRARLLLPVALILSACQIYEIDPPYATEEIQSRLTLPDVAHIMSRLPLDESCLNEVHDAVSASSGNGYDEEYMMSDLFGCPGSGVGDGGSSKATSYPTPLRDLLSDWFHSQESKAGFKDAQAYLDELAGSDMQIYWPFSEDWNGRDYPIITFDPGYGAESNFGYELYMQNGKLCVRDSVLVTEAVALQRPVWVINRNDDSGFTPYELYTKSLQPRQDINIRSAPPTLVLKSFKMLRQFDNWFAGASEFFVKVGSTAGWKITEENDMRDYSPGVTDFMIVIKRKYVRQDVPFNAILIDDFNEYMDKIALLIVEDDGGTQTSWKCEVSAKWNSRSYGFNIDIPYNEKDDIAWRGQLSADWFRTGAEATGRFGDVCATFAVE